MVEFGFSELILRNFYHEGITNSDIKSRWLSSDFPNLYYDADSHKILGELDFCAVYDQESGKVTIANLTEETDFLIRDVFEVRFAWMT